jgi:hypothetical protein
MNATPWKAEKEGELYRYIVDARGITVCHLPGVTSKNHEAIAHGVVRAVNSYNAMREALTELWAYAQIDEYSDHDGGRWKPLSKKVLAALSLVGVKP